MTITHPKSVLILGAGVSEPFGMPLGGQLIDLIADQIEAETPDVLGDTLNGGKAFDPSRVVDWCHSERWYKHPLYGTAIRQVLNRGSLDYSKALEVHSQIQSLRGLLRNQTAETIDSFIAENPKSAPLTKLLLAAFMLRCSYHAPKANSGQPLKARSFASRVLRCEHRRTSASVTPTERNWIHLLINIIRHAIDEKQVSPGNKIKIITFNYDTILEHVLAEQFANRETRLEHYAEYIEIHHVHGKLGAIQEHCNDPGLVAAEWAKGICVVKEDLPCEDVIQARARAKELIAAAHSVYAVGFAFAGPNCRLLGLHEQPTNHLRTIRYCNYDGNRGIKEAAGRYSRHVDDISGDWSRPVGVTDFIRAGHLGEPPN